MYPYTVATPGSAAVGTAGTVVLAANGNRQYALFANYSDTPIWLGFGGPGTVGMGVPLKAAAGTADGGAYEMSSAFGNLFTGSISAVTPSGTGKGLAYLEGS